jgi:hypothetical protein
MVACAPSDRLALDDEATGASTSAGQTGTGASDTDDSWERFDVGANDGGEEEGPGTTACHAKPPYQANPDPDPDIVLSNIWIANSPEGTVSKLDTVTGVELGRYLTHHPPSQDPSRTSVNLGGDVAVANRLRGVIKIHARPEDCTESNGQPGIQTSSGSNDVLAWGDDECVAWSREFAEFSRHRATAWTPDDLLWTSGLTADAEIVAVLLDGDDGSTQATVHTGVTTEYSGAYGGAVDGEGNFWFSTQSEQLVRVELDTMEVETWSTPISAYGMTVDHHGQPWVCGGGVARFDPVAETWAVNDDFEHAAGCMADARGMVWIAGSESVRKVDLVDVHDVVEYPLCDYVHGVSVDAYGYVWGVSMGDIAFRIDPDGGGYTWFDGLVQPYTYSDMTGMALHSVAGEPPT